MENNLVTKQELENYKNIVSENFIILKNVDEYQKKQIEELKNRVDELNSIISQFLIK